MRVLLVAAPMVGHVLPLRAARARLPRRRARGAARHRRRRGRRCTAGRGPGPGRRARADHGPGHGRLVAAPSDPGRPDGARGRGTDGVGLMFASVNAAMAPATSRWPTSGGRTWCCTRGWCRSDRLPPHGAAYRRSWSTPCSSTPASSSELWRTTSTGPLPASASTCHRNRPTPSSPLRPSVVGERRGRPMRYVAAGGDGEVPELSTRPGTRPMLLVSRSTVDDPRPRPVDDAGWSRPRRAPTSTSPRATRPRGRPPALPSNVTTTDWLPFAAVLPHVAGVVHHGGAGTLMSALVAGVPQIVVPGAGDRTRHARLIAPAARGSPCRCAS